MAELPSIQFKHTAVLESDGEPMPAIVAESGPAARFAWEEFVYGELRNLRTRHLYCDAVRRFLSWSSGHGIELAKIAPAHVGRYLDGLALAKTTKKLHLAALRKYFDELVLRHVVVLNPAASVRGDRLSAVEGKTPAISVKQARTLLNSIDLSTVVGLRDRAVIGILIYTAARVGTIPQLRRADFFDGGEQHYLRMNEKRNKFRELPVRHDLCGFILDYVIAGGLEYSDKTSSLFRTTTRRTKNLTQNGMTANDISRMIKRRLADAHLPRTFSPHSFRVCTITDLLSQGVPLEDVQLLAGHADPRTTRLYDRRYKKVTRNIVERISI